MRLRTWDRAKRAFTLVEMAIVMAVVGVILGGIMWAAGNSREAQRQSEAVNELQSIAQNVSTMMAGRTFVSPYVTGYSLNATMRDAQAIPGSYMNIANTATIDHPWKSGGVELTVQGATTFRITFNDVSRSGCLALLLQGTACQAGQMGCPIKVWTAGTSQSCVFNQTDCTGATIGIGWQVLGATRANTMCGANNYTGGTNSVSFDYSTY